MTRKHRSQGLRTGPGSLMASSLFDGFATRGVAAPLALRLAFGGPPLYEQKTECQAHFLPYNSTYY